VPKGVKMVKMIMMAMVMVVMMVVVMVVMIIIRWPSRRRFTALFIVFVEILRSVMAA
jgi:hypothetical protein